MPAFGDQLGDDDITDLIAYLDTLPAGPRNFGPEMMDRDGMMGGLEADAYVSEFIFTIGAH